MPASQKCMAKIAAHFGNGIDATNSDSVEHFYQNELPRLPDQQQEQVLYILLSLEGVADSELDDIMLEEFDSETKQNTVQEYANNHDVDLRKQSMEIKILQEEISNIKTEIQSIKQAMGLKAMNADLAQARISDPSDWLSNASIAIKNMANFWPSLIMHSSVESFVLLRKKIEIEGLNQDNRDSLHSLQEILRLLSGNQDQLALLTEKKSEKSK